MLSDVTIGQYYPSTSFIHKMDPRIKILLLIAYIVLIFIVKTFYGFICVGALFLLMVIFSKVPFLDILKSLKSILIILLITVVLNLLFYNQDSKVLLDLKFTKITEGGVLYAGFMALRLSLLIMGSSLLNFTTTPIALTDGIESLLKPLKVIHFPVHELALVMSIALRFIPILVNETDRIIMAQKARGADFESGNIFSRVKALIPILIPLLISAFRKAEELGDAMDARCYNGSKNRTKFRKLKMSFRDLIGILIFAIFFGGVIFINTL